jgi:hypothetical protein
MSVPSLQIVYQKNRRFLEKLAFENYKRQLAGLPLLERDPHAPIQLITFRQAHQDLGVCEKTLERRLAPKGAAANSDRAA